MKPYSSSAPLIQTIETSDPEFDRLRAHLIESANEPKEAVQTFRLLVTHDLERLKYEVMDDVLRMQVQQIVRQLFNFADMHHVRLEPFTGARVVDVDVVLDTSSYSMALRWKTKPTIAVRFAHDVPNVVFLGFYDDYDLYCELRDGLPPIMVARWSNGPCEVKSTLDGDVDERSPIFDALSFAFARAAFLNYVGV